ncbi:hypothetical protein LOD99_7999 [Oopsacas minuta]|uniref:Uncharacterized protein n=1 Tax=Oopsacas minuta TaxID=111878 RepID=A0AAV7JIN3_9METZ|nr:hypothetical protein LOD99_7999 [Oopsacas minuta]
MALLNVAFIGCGAVNFGGAEGPWNHSKRLELIQNIHFVAIMDVDISKANRVLETKLQGEAAAKYTECKIFSNLDDLFSQMKGRIDAVWVGVPPYVHGVLDEGRDLELRCIREGINVFMEKPISVYPVKDVSLYADAIEKETTGQGKPYFSVGYMFRYHPAIIQAKEILNSHSQPILMINARYNCAYSELDHPFWWNKKESGGPIVEQATHFCDLFRFFGGEVNLNSVTSKIIPAGDKGKIGYLSTVPDVVKEDKLPLDDRVPRVTVSHFYFKSGALGSLTHGITLHAKRYEASIDIWCDGLRILLEEPYSNELCRLRVRKGYTDTEELFAFPGADCYMEEDLAFVRAVLERNPALIASNYSDALQSYKLSWSITDSVQKE